jgi:hypothetical protein
MTLSAKPNEFQGLGVIGMMFFHERIREHALALFAAIRPWNVASLNAMIQARSCQQLCVITLFAAVLPLPLIMLFFVGFLIGFTAQLVFQTLFRTRLVELRTRTTIPRLQTGELLRRFYQSALWTGSGVQMFSHNRTTVTY